MLQIAKCCPQSLNTVSHMKAHIVTTGLDPLYFPSFQEQQISFVSEDKAVVICTGLTKERTYLIFFLVPSSLGNALLRPLYAGPKSFPTKRFEQVVYRRYFKGPKRILVMRGHENHKWKSRIGNTFENRKSVATRHLDIEKHEVGVLLRD